MLDEGRHGSVSDLAAAEKLDRGDLGRILMLTLLTPDIVEAILDALGDLALGRAAERRDFGMAGLAYVPVDLGRRCEESVEVGTDSAHLIDHADGNEGDSFGGATVGLFGEELALRGGRGAGEGGAEFFREGIARPTEPGLVAIGAECEVVGGVHHVKPTRGGKEE